MENLDPLDQEGMNIKDHFKSYIKDKKIDELIAYDNKLFSEVRNLESEKHILVTQNYKKFVSATETINTIKTNLVSFESDLLNLKDKIGNLVANFNKINSSVDTKLQKTEEIYKIKKDLKRLKFISDLPNILESQLKLYLNSNINNEQNQEKGNAENNEKDITILGKSLNYYEKCKEFIKIHKENNLVKDIFKRTSEFIYKYRSLINDEMNNINLTEENIDKLDNCLGLLVKINDDKSELIDTFINRYINLINSKYENIFSTNKDITEISFDLFSKIYDNYEFAINENDYIFYEQEIMRNNNQPGQQGQVGQNINVNLSTLASKFFKKGTFIWICKQVIESIINKLLLSSYERFIKLFGNDSAEKFNKILTYTIDTFYKNIKNYFEKFMYDNKITVDPEFFREGLLAFYNNFKNKILGKINDNMINNKQLSDDILNKNREMVNIYISNINCCYINDIHMILNEIYENLGKCKNNDGNYDMFHRINMKYYNSQIDMFINKYEEICRKFSKIIKSLSLELFNTGNNFGYENDNLYFSVINNLFTIFIMIIQSNNTMKFKGNDYMDLYIKLSKEEKDIFYKENINNIKDIILKNKEKQDINTSIFFDILLLKRLQQNNYTKIIEDRYLTELQFLKKNKNLYVFLKESMDKKIIESIKFLFDGIVLIKNKEIFTNLKELYHSKSLAKITDSPATFRKDLKTYLYSLYEFKINLMTVLSEEAAKFHENKTNIIDNFQLKRNKTVVQIEMEKLQIRRLAIYGEECVSPQQIIYTICKIFLKTMNELIKICHFNIYGFQVIQVELSFIQFFFRKFLIFNDKDNITDGFFNEIIKNCIFNTYDFDQSKKFQEDFINDLMKLFEKEFSDIQTVDENEPNNEEINTDSKIEESKGESIKENA